jgi:hypothetical protein
VTQGRLSALLRIALPAFFAANWLFGAVAGVLGILSASGERRPALAFVIVGTLVFWGVILSLLSYAAVRTWRWGFWAYVVLLAAGVIVSGASLIQTRNNLIGAAVPGFVALILLGAAAYGWARFGPWALGRKGIRSDPALR